MPPLAPRPLLDLNASPQEKKVLLTNLVLSPFTGLRGGAGAAVGGVLASRLFHKMPAVQNLVGTPAAASVYGSVAGYLLARAAEDDENEKKKRMRAAPVAGPVSLPLLKR